MNPTLDLLQDLIRRPSITPEDAGCQQLIGERLQAAGFTVLRFWNNEVLQQTEVVLTAIWQKLEALNK